MSLKVPVGELDCTVSERFAEVIGAPASSTRVIEMGRVATPTPVCTLAGSATSSAAKALTPTSTVAASTEVNRDHIRQHLIRRVAVVSQ